MIPSLRIRETRFTIALQEALIALAPFVILSAFLTLLSQLPIYLGRDIQGFFATLTNLADGLRPFVSIAIVLSLAYHFARRYDVEPVQAMLLSLAVFLNSRVLLQGVSVSLPPNIDIWQITIPIASVFLLKALLPLLSLPLDPKNCLTYSCRVLRHLYAFLISYVVLLAGWWVVQYIGIFIASQARSFAAAIPNGLLLGVRTLVSQASWSIGIHGNRLANSLFGRALYTREIFPNLTYGQFYRLFAVSGGSGMGLSMLLALFLAARDRHSRQIARVSAPFVIFNINTVIIYCLPIAFNPFLVLPFIFIPLLNLAIAYGLLSIMPVTFHAAIVPWTTPAFIDSWIVGGGNPWLPLLQLFLILLDTLIYIPFIKQFSHTRSDTYYPDSLNRHLELPESLHMHHGLNLHKVQHEILEANLRLNETINLLSPDTLRIYYQPKIGIQTHKCVGYEALLRIQSPSPHSPLRGPFFLRDIEDAGLSPILDVWVCHQVKAHLQTWEAQGFTPPMVSINLHPDTINNTEAIDKIIHLLEGFPIEFEIIERSLLKGQQTVDSLKRLKQHGFRLAVDDFGQGYSSYRFLSQVDVNTVKTDLSLIDLLNQTKGRHIWEHMIGLCHRLNIQIVAEGVETAEQVRVLAHMGVDAIQGFFFAQAMPMSEIPDYQPPPFPDETQPL